MSALSTENERHNNGCMCVVGKRETRDPPEPEVGPILFFFSRQQERLAVGKDNKETSVAWDLGF